MSELIIAGIDPGTTTAYGILDLKGNLIEAKSEKNFGLNSLIEKITAKGTVLAVGTDRKELPKMIELFAAKTGARTATPNHDMFEGEKTRMTKGYEYKNEHEKDAIASAIVALKEFEPLIRKIDAFVEENGKQEIRDKIMKMVILNKVSIKKAADIIEKPEETAEEEKITITKEYTPAEHLELQKRFLKLKRENKFLKKQRKRLVKELDRATAKEKQLACQLERFISKERAKDRKENRMQAVDALQKLLAEKEEKAKEAENEAKKLKAMLMDVKDNVVAKKLKNLGWEEYSSKKETLKIKQGDVLFVDDPNVYSQKTAEELKNVDIIIHKEPINKKTRTELHFIFISSSKLKIQEDRDMAIVSKKELEEEKQKTGIIERVVEGYRKGRT